MLWPALILVAAVAAVIFIERSWRKKFANVQAGFRREIERLETAHEEAVLQLRTRQEAAFNSMTEGLLLLDARGRITLANRAFENLFGVTTNIRSRTMIEVVRSHELAELVELLNTESPVLDRELKLSVPAERWLQVNGAALLDDKGAQEGAILVFHDLTRLKKLESARKDFVANVSHELRTPLSLIKGYVETLLDGAKDNPDVSSKFLSTIQRNADRLQLLIEDLLTISELEAGRMELHLEPLALQPLVQKVLEDLQGRASVRGVTLSNQAGNLQVEGDSGRLEQVLGNLVDNAIKYGRQGGSVTIDARSVNGGLVEVCVKDDGPGIPPDALERVFERFYRVDKARSREQGGTGLGLSIVKHIVQSHGGKVWATSEPGRGANFFFTIPQNATAN
jgi:two-component system phosphate regulon sensor histidine kinase PhoR